MRFWWPFILVGCATDASWETTPELGGEFMERSTGPSDTAAGLWLEPQNDNCPTDPYKTAPGLCGCEFEDLDLALPEGPETCVHINALVEGTIGVESTIGSGAVVAARASVGPRTIIHSGAYVAPLAVVGQDSVIGARTVVGRRAVIGDRTVIGPDSQVGRSAQIGDDVLASPGQLSVGYAASLGDRSQVLGAGVTLGNLVDIGADSSLSAGVVVARETSFGPSATLLQAAVIGPDGTFGEQVTVGERARIRKGADVHSEVTIGDDARIGRSGVLEFGAVVGDDARLAALVTVPVCMAVPEAERIRRGVTYDGSLDPGCTPPANQSPWIALGEGGQTVQFRAVTTDSSGNLYVGGSLTGTMTVNGTGSYGPGSNQSAFIAKFDDEGTLRWFSLVDSASYDWVVDLAWHAGELYAAGRYSGLATFGAHSVTSVNGTDVFVTKLDDATGTFQWAASAGGDSAEDVTGIVADDGGAYVTGEFDTPIAFGSTTLTEGDNGGSIFVAHISDDGVWQWAKQGGGFGSNVPGPIIISPSGNHLVGLTFQYGWNTGPDSFGQALTVSGTRKEIAIVEMTPAGATVATNQIGGPGDDTVFALHSDGEHVTMAASYRDALTFGSTSMPDPGDENTYVGALTPSGAPLQSWYAVGGNRTNNPVGVARAGDTIYTTGRMSFGSIAGTVVFGGISLTDVRTQAFVAAVDTAAATGPTDWSWAVKSDNTTQTSDTNVFPYQLAARSFGGSHHIYVAGQWAGSPTMGSFALPTVPSLSDGFLVHLLGDGTW